MTYLLESWHVLKQFPDYIPAAEAAATILIMALPIYFALWYFLHNRRLPYPWQLQFASLGSFVLFAGLAFLFASPLTNKLPAFLLSAYLLITCAVTAYTVVPLMDVFLIEYYLMGIKKVYVSPPLRKIINFSVFFLLFLPILHYVLQFNPFTKVAIPTIATAGLAFALQDTFKAFFAGVGLGNLIRVGDWIAYEDKEGRVMDINWARAVLKTLHGDLLFIPNTLLLTKPFLNYSAHHHHRFMIKIGVSYQASPDRVKSAMEECAQNLPDVLETPKPVAQVLSFTDSGVQYGLFYWVDDYGKHYDVQDKLATRIWDAFQKEGFALPFPFPVHPIDGDINKTHPLNPVKSADLRVQK